MIAAMLPRGDVRDVLVVPEGSDVKRLEDLPADALVGSSSVRRKAQINRARPNLQVVRIRGTVGTRLAKMDGTKPMDAEMSAMVLASSGLERLGLTDRARHVFEPDEILPAVGPGVLALECRRDDADVTGLLLRLNDAKTQTEATAERVRLHGLRGHCNSPITGYCVTDPTDNSPCAAWCSHGTDPSSSTPTSGARA
ncbi:hypothetical protein [Streptomyces sp. NPDC056682]|uniref:hypothetical protein n=1 Tax=Streptomyces sp. NPDC056682 TaxID=3345909 RepID=UPI0036964F2B